MIKIDNTYINPEGLVGMTKDEFIKTFTGVFTSDINAAWKLVSKQIPKAEKKVEIKSDEVKPKKSNKRKSDN